MKVLKTTYIEVTMLAQIEDHMKEHNIPFTEFIRRAAASYLNHNQTVTKVSINDSEPIEQPIDIIDDVVKEALKDIPKDTEQPPTDNTPKANKNNFNWDGLDIK